MNNITRDDIDRLLCENNNNGLLSVAVKLTDRIFTLKNDKLIKEEYDNLSFKENDKIYQLKRTLVTIKILGWLGKNYFRNDTINTEEIPLDFKEILTKIDKIVEQKYG